MKRREVLALAPSAGVAVAGCLGSNGTDDEEIVEITGVGSAPPTLSIDRDTTVTWVNDIQTMPREETLVSAQLIDDATEWDFYAELQEGDEVSHTFSRDGLYTYAGERSGKECLCGLIEVGDASHDSELPCAPISDC